MNSELKAQVIADLQTTEKNLFKRMGGLKIGVTCGRCLGSGHYSYCQTHGTRCFGCGGVGVVAPKTDAQWLDVAAQAREAAQSGKVDAYLEQLRARAKSKNGFDRAFAAWKKLDELNGYGGNWRNATDEQKEINKLGASLIDDLRKLDKGVKTDWVAYERRLSDGLAALEEARAALSKSRE